MKILHIINLMKLGGAQSLLVSLTKEQKAAGHEVEILQLVETPDKTLIEQVEANGIPVVTLSKGNSVYSPFKVFPLIKHLKACDIAHVHLFPAQYWVVFAKLISGVKIPLVTTEHSTQNKRRKKQVWQFIDTWIYKKYDCVVACAEKALETFKRDYPDKSIKCIAIPNGVDVKKYHDAESYSKKYLLGCKEKDVIITMVARFAYPKRQDTLVKSLKYLPEQCHVALVGGCETNDEGLEKMRSLSEEIGVGPRVHFLYARKDVPQILKSSDFIVMSSEYEGLSLSSLEGMASGVFLASEVNGLKEVVEGAGILFKSCDENDLASKIRSLLSDKQLYEDVKERCYRRAKEYDIGEMSRRYIDIYKLCFKKYSN